MCILLFVLTPTPGWTQEKEEVPEFLQPENYDELTIEEFGVIEKDTDRVILRWELSHPASARLRYGRSKQTSEVLTFGGRRRTHEVELTDLEEGTYYGYQLRSRDHSGNRARSKFRRFRTEGFPPPRFKDVKVIERTLDGGVVQWKTNIRTRATFTSDYDTRFRFQTKHEGFARKHRVRLNSFGPGREITFSITVEDTRGRTNQKSGRFQSRENNVAWDKPVKGTFDRTLPGLPSSARGGSGPVLPRIVDNDYNYKSGMATSGDPADTDQWIVIDLEHLYRPDTVVVYWRHSAYPENYQLLGSVTGARWNVLKRGLNAREGARKTTPGGGATTQKQVITRFQKIDEAIRFIKLVVPKGSPYYTKYDSYKYVQLMELKVFPKPTRNLFNRVTD